MRPCRVTVTVLERQGTNVTDGAGTAAARDRPGALGTNGAGTAAARDHPGAAGQPCALLLGFHLTFWDLPPVQRVVFYVSPPRRAGRPGPPLPRAA